MLRLSLLFFLTFVSLIGKSDTPYSKKFLITGINEQYAGSEELQNEFKKITQEILLLWDSIALVNETIIIDTLGQHDQLTNRYVAHFTVSQVYDEIIKKEHYRYLVEMENVNTGERFREFSTSFTPGSNSFPPSKEMIKIYFTPSNLNLTVPGFKRIGQVKPTDSVKTFQIRSINFDPKKFDETQQNFLINVINNAFIAGEKNNTLFNKALPSWGSSTDYYTMIYTGENNMNDPTIDHVLDFDIRMDEDNNRIKVSFELAGREEPNLLLPSRFLTEIEFDAHSFQIGELYEASTKLSQHLYSLIRRQYFFYKTL